LETKVESRDKLSAGVVVVMAVSVHRSIGIKKWKGYSFIPRAVMERTDRMAVGGGVNYCALLVCTPSPSPEPPHPQQSSFLTNWQVYGMTAVRRNHHTPVALSLLVSTDSCYVYYPSQWLSTCGPRNHQSKGAYK